MKIHHYILGVVLLLIIYLEFIQRPKLLKLHSSKISKAVVYPQPNPKERVLEKPVIPRELVYDYKGASTPFPPVGSVLSEKTGNLTY